MSAMTHLWEGVGQQLRCPTGRWGRLTGRFMAVVNREPNRIAIDALGVDPGDTILELGFGPGKGIRALADLAPRGLVVGIDRSADMLAQASRANRDAIERGRVRLGLGRFDDLPLASASVDKILAVNVVYFFSETGGEMRQALRVLRPGGVMAVYATHRSTMSQWKFAGPDTHAHIDEERLRALAAGGGFGADAISIDSVQLPLGVKGLVGLFRKPMA